MALAILDGTQTATTLSTILSSGQHITAHTVVSLGTQAKTDILSAVSSGIAISGTVTVGSLPAISGTVTIGNSYVNFLSANQNDGNLRENINEALVAFGAANALPISGTLHADIYAYSTQSDDQIKLRGYSNGGQGVCLEVCGPSINGVTVGGIPGVPVFGSVTVGNTVTIAGTVTANLSISSTAITSGSFASLTSATLVPGNVARKMATVFNQGAGQLFVNAGATATTLGGGFMVALSSGDYFECDYTTTTLSAIFATAGTASWVSH